MALTPFCPEKILQWAPSGAGTPRPTTSRLSRQLAVFPVSISRRRWCCDLGARLPHPCTCIICHTSAGMVQHSGFFSNTNTRVRPGSSLQAELNIYLPSFGVISRASFSSPFFLFQEPASLQGRHRSSFIGAESDNDVKPKPKINRPVKPIGRLRARLNQIQHFTGSGSLTE